MLFDTQLQEYSNVEMKSVWLQMEQMINITKFWNDKILKQKVKLFPDDIGHQIGEFVNVILYFHVIVSKHIS